jgi:hypothetical protein
MNDRISFLCSVIDPVWFTRRYVQIYDATQHRWRPFSLWPVQGSVLARMKAERKLVVLKARQLGISWLSLAYALWLLVCRPPCLACSSGRRRYTVGVDPAEGNVHSDESVACVLDGKTWAQAGRLRLLEGYDGRLGWPSIAGCRRPDKKHAEPTRVYLRGFALPRETLRNLAKL